MPTLTFLGRYYTCDPQEIYHYEKEWVSNLKNEIIKTSTHAHNYLINLTWIDREKQYDWINWIDPVHTPDMCKVWLSGSIDGFTWITNSDFYDRLKQKGYQISTVGYSEEHWHSWFPYWLYNKNQKIDTTLRTVKYLYLNYNRKPKTHRLNLVDSLRDNNLLCLGYVTFQKGYYQTLDETTGNTEQDFHEIKVQNEPTNYIKEKDIQHSRPEDVCSLGNLEIWNNSYLNVVSETEFYDQYHLSEKTWKPIIGLRPFVLNSNPTVSKVLEKLGFYTPAMLFKRQDLDNCDVESIVSLVNELKNLNDTQIYNLYQEQFPMLQHNYKRFTEIATGDRTKILNWPQAIK